MKQLTHLYDQLTAKERFAVAVSALARGDLDELDRLNDTCPRKRYEIGDLAYHTRVNELWRLALLVKTELLRLSQNMAATLAVIVTLETGDDEDAENYETAQAAYRRMCELLKAKQSAWNDFCSDLGMQGDEVLRAFHLGDDENDFAGIVLSLDLNNESEADEVARQRMLMDLRGCWETVEGKLQ